MKLPCLPYVTLAFLLGFTSPSFGQQSRPSDSDLADSALRAYLSRPDYDRRQEIIQSARLDVMERASRNPNEEVGATIVFDSGKTTDEIGELLRQRNLNFIRAEIKVPYGNHGMVRTISIGSFQIFQRNRPTQEALEAEIGSIRYEYISSVEHRIGEDKDNFMELAHAPMKIYKLEVYGPVNELRNVLNRADVAALFVDSDRVDMNGVKWLKQEFDAVRNKLSGTREN